jgi:hypothetical protein
MNVFLLEIDIIYRYTYFLHVLPWATMSYCHLATLHCVAKSGFVSVSEKGCRRGLFRTIGWSRSLMVLMF